MGKLLYVLESRVTDLEKEREDGRGDDYPSSNRPVLSRPRPSRLELDDRNRATSEVRARCVPCHANRLCKSHEPRVSMLRYMVA